MSYFEKFYVTKFFRIRHGFFGKFCYIIITYTHPTTILQKIREKSLDLKFLKSIMSGVVKI